MTEKKPKDSKPPIDPSKLHVKPTKKQLEADAKALLKKSEKLKENPPSEDDQIGLEPEGEDDPTPEPKDPEKPEDEEEEEEEPTPSPPPKEEKETPEDPKPGDSDYKKRYKASSAEGQILYARNKKLSDAMTKKVSEPTKEEIVEEYPDYEDMTDSEQKRAVKNIKNDRRFEMLGNVSEEFQNVEKWNNKVDKFLIDPETLVKTPELEGREEEFKTFVSKESRRGVDFETLVLAFKQTIDDTKPVKNKGAMFEKGTGGDNIKPKPVSDKITVEESGKLRLSNYPLYIKYLKAGKIEPLPAS